MSSRAKIERVRLQRVLAAAGIASRRGAEAWIRDGRVTVNGHVATLGESADPSRDAICVDGAPIQAEPLAYWLVHKPMGVVTTRRDPEGRASIVDLVPERGLRLFPVGRLDRASTGLVLLTNDGPLAHALLHPSHEVEREYVVRVRGAMRESTLRRLAAGVELDGGRERTAPAGIDRVRRVGDTTFLNLTLVEGRKRQIRRALLELGHPVLELRRIRMGPLRLGRLASGAARPLTAQERRELLRQSGLEASRARSSPAKRPRRRGKDRSSKQSRNRRVSD